MWIILIILEYYYKIRQRGQMLIHKMWIKYMWNFIFVLENHITVVLQLLFCCVFLLCTPNCRAPGPRGGEVKAGEDGEEGEEGCHPPLPGLDCCVARPH